MEKHFGLLGRKGEDMVTGFKGIITSLSFDLYGCIQVVITPPADEKGDIKEGHWFDITRIEVSAAPSKMAVPDFKEGYISTGKKGCATKPMP